MVAISALLTLALPLLAAAHGVILSVPGGNGRVGRGIGVGPATTTGHSAFNYAPRWLKSRPSVCGVHRSKGTLDYYMINWQSELKQQVKKGLPTTQGNTVTMKYWQVNKDGAGPMACEVSSNASGKNWKPMKITQNVPGNRGRSNQVQQFHTLKAQLPSGVSCTGYGGACLVRCTNRQYNPNGFGGCVAIKRGNGKRSVEGAEEGVTTSEGEDLLL